LPIADLVPLEGSVVTSAVDTYRQQIANGTPPAPVTVLQAGGEWLVVDGNHRVVAAMRPSDQVAVRFGHLSRNGRFAAAA
jgi:hypothetical protein